MGAVEDLWKSAQDSIRERLDSPLLVAFAVSWSLWNYKFLLILLSQNSVTATLHLIETVAFTGPWDKAIRGVILPALSAAVFIVVYPHLARYTFAYLRRQQVRLNAARQQIDNETLLTREESRELRLRMRELHDNVAQLEDELAQAKDAERQLRAQNAELQRSAVERTGSIEEGATSEDWLLQHAQERKVSNQMRSILRLLAQVPTGLPASDIVSRVDAPTNAVFYAIGELVKKGLAQEVRRVAGSEPRYVITHEGRGIVLDEEP